MKTVLVLLPRLSGQSLAKSEFLQSVLKVWQWVAQVAQWFGAAFSPRCGPGDLGSSPTSGSLHGACFSLCLCLCLPLSLSLSLSLSLINNNNNNKKRVFKLQSKWALSKFWNGQPRWLSSLVPPSAQGVVLETWDRVPHRAPCMEPASPSACVSASLYVSWINK